MLDVFALALGLGLAFNAAPGAVFTESLRHGIRGGFRPAFDVQIGSLLGDATWAVLGLAGVGALFTVPGLRVPLTVAGCLLLGWLGLAGVLAGLRSPALAVPTEPPQRNAMAAGAVISLGNPMNVLYWSGAAGAVSGGLGEDATATALVVFFLGFMTSSALWCLACAGAIALLRRTMPTTVVRFIELACGAALLTFAALLLHGLAS
jgi:chemosensory pili system protein ChpE